MKYDFEEGDLLTYERQLLPNSGSNLYLQVKNKRELRDHGFYMSATIKLDIIRMSIGQ